MTTGSAGARVAARASRPVVLATPPRAPRPSGTQSPSGRAMSVVGAMRNLAMTPNSTAVARRNHRPAIADASSAPSLLSANVTVHAAKPTIATATHSTIAPADAA